MNSNDLKGCQDVVQSLINDHGTERSLAILLMSLGNVFKHLCLNVSEQKYNEIMKDPVICLSAKAALDFMKAGDPIMKKWGLRKEKND